MLSATSFWLNENLILPRTFLSKLLWLKYFNKMPQFWAKYSNIHNSEWTNIPSTCMQIDNKCFYLQKRTTFHSKANITLGNSSLGRPYISIIHLNFTSGPTTMAHLRRKKSRESASLHDTEWTMSPHFTRHCASSQNSSFAEAIHKKGTRTRRALFYYLWEMVGQVRASTLFGIIKKAGNSNSSSMSFCPTSVGGDAILFHRSQQKDSPQETIDGFQVTSRTIDRLSFSFNGTLFPCPCVSLQQVDRSLAAIWMHF